MELDKESPQEKEQDSVQEAFDRMLRWLNPDPQKAGEKYEEIRYRLIRILAKRGCYNAEDVTDKVINRVMSKVHEIADKYVGDPAIYFYAVAQKVFLEQARKVLEVQVNEEALRFINITDFDSEADKEEYFSCLNICLEKLPSKERDVIIQYYKFEKQAKINARKELAQQLGCNMKALRMRIHRIRTALLQCIQECLKRN